MDLRKRTGNHNWKKVFDSMIIREKGRDLTQSCDKNLRIPWFYDNDRKENTLIYAHHISYKNIRNFCRLFEPDCYTKLDKKKNASKEPNNLLKSNCKL